MFLGGLEHSRAARSSLAVCGCPYASEGHPEG